MNRLLKSITGLLLLAVTILIAACGSRSTSPRGDSIDGTYVYQDGVSRSVVTVSENEWHMKTQFGAPGYYGNDAKYDSGKVEGNILYHSGFIEYGKVSGNTLKIPGRSYRKE